MANEPHSNIKLPFIVILAKALLLAIIAVSITSLIGGISTAPYSLQHFHRFTSYGLIANLLAMPVMSLIVMPAAVLSMLLRPFGLDTPFLHVMGFGISLVIKIANLLASWGGVIDLGRQPTWFLPAVTIGLTAAFMLRTKLAYFGFALVALVMGSVAMANIISADNPDMLIYEDGSLVALKVNNQLHVNKNRPSSFIFNQWRSAYQFHSTAVSAKKANSLIPSDDSKGAAMIEHLIGEAKLNDPSVFVCHKSELCAAITRYGQIIVTVNEPEHLGAACDYSNIVITSVATRMSNCRSGAVFIGRQILRRTGSMEIDLSDKLDAPIKLINTSFPETKRHWNIHRNYDWCTDSYITDIPADIVKLID